MESVQQTLRKSREISERYKEFMERKIIYDLSMKETNQKIEATQKTLKQTHQTVKSIQDMYSKYEDMMDKVFDAAIENLKQNGGWIAGDENYQPFFISDKQLTHLFQEKNHIVFITGAGMSAASGIPTFRGKGGFWNKNSNEDIDPELILTNKHYEQYPFETWKWLQDFYLLKTQSKPNKGHIALAQIIHNLLKKGKSVSLITQNIDNFHIEAEKEIISKNQSNQKCQTFQVHGNVTFVRCQKCSEQHNKLICYPYQQFKGALSQQTSILCPQCKSNLRPHVMFFDEFYQENLHHSQSANKVVNDADLVVIIGTTLSTGLVSNLVCHAINNDKNGQKIVVQINPECQIKKNKVRKIEQNSEQVLCRAFNLLIK